MYLVMQKHSIQARVRENIVGDRFEEAREGWRVVRFRTAVDVNRVYESQIALRARCCHIQKATFFFQIVKFILKPIRWKPSVRHPDNEEMIPLQTFSRVHGR